MKTIAVRLPASLHDTVTWVQQHTGEEMSTALRRLVRLGVERELAEQYRRGDITLRTMADVLDMPLRDVLECLWRLGVSGNVSAEQTLAALATANQHQAPDAISGRVPTEEPRTEA